MTSHYDLSDEQFEQEFSNCSLDPKLFNHTAHLRLGFLYAKQYGLEVAIEKVCQQIQQFDRTHGDGTKFNRELTELSVKAIYYHIEEGMVNSFSSFLLRYPSFTSSFKSVLEEYQQKKEKLG
ncbi:MAG: hypothetical protein AAFX87_14105 [Bacteroidota bacterium]